GVDQSLGSADVQRRGVGAGRQYPGNYPVVSHDRLRHRHADLDFELAGHLDDVVLPERWPGRGHAVSGKPAEYFADQGRYDVANLGHSDEHLDRGVGLFWSLLPCRFTHDTDARA